MQTLHTLFAAPIRRWAFVFCLFLPLACLNAAEGKRTFSIPAGPATRSLKQFSEQSGRTLIVDTDVIREVKMPAVQGEMAPADALELLIADSGLVASLDKQTGGFALRKETGAERKNVNRAIAESGRPRSRNRDEAVDVESKPIVLDTFEVFGRKTLNMDLRRSRDDAQPYVTFDRVEIERSGSTNLEEFLRQRLTMNVVAASSGQAASNFVGFASTINLRGIGQDQTLILIDGHRVPDFNIGNTVRQADFNNIPVAAVERIEVLPATSSGIYGGSATGGVINIILRRDYTGVEVRTTYENTFGTDSATRRLDVNAGLTLGRGKTNILIAATYQDSNYILARDRNLVQAGSAQVRANNPNLPNFLSSSPPLGFTPNIRSGNGAPLVLKSGTPLNSLITFVPVGYAGAATDQGAALVPNAGRYNFDLANDATNSGSIYGGGASIYNAPRQESLMATFRHQFSARFQAFLELSAANSIGKTRTNLVTSTFTLQAAAPNNPFQQAIIVTVPQPGGDGEMTTSNQNRRIVTGVIVQLPRTWKAEADYTWQQYTYTKSGANALKSAGTTAITSGALNIVRDVNAFPLDISPYLGTRFYSPDTTSELNDVALRASGQLGTLPTGPLQAAALVEHRQTDMNASRDVHTADGIYNYYPSRTQTVSSGYVEIHVPLLKARTEGSTSPFELQLAGRWDDYSTDGGANASSIPLASPPPAVARGVNNSTAASPTVALRFQPTKDVAFRLSFGRGFQPPTLTQLVTATGTFPGGVGFVDPRRGNTDLGGFTFVSGGNPSLRPERSTTWSGGIVLSPSHIPGLRISADYIRLKKADNIAGATGNFQGLVLAEDLNPGRVIRGTNLPGDQPGWAGPVTLLDFTLLNIARANLEAYDFQADYTRLTPMGKLSLFGMATYTTSYETQLTPTAAPVENVGVGRFNPLKLRANLGATLTAGRWTIGWTAYYYDSYLVSATPSVQVNQGSGGKVPSQIYHDVSLAYHASSKSSGRLAWLLANLELQAGVKNVGNTAPPLDASVTGQLYSTLGDPRLARYFLSLKKAF